MNDDELTAALHLRFENGWDANVIPDSAQVRVMHLCSHRGCYRFAAGRRGLYTFCSEACRDIEREALKAWINDACHGCG